MGDLAAVGVLAGFGVGERRKSGTELVAGEGDGRTLA
jgi:hypothetical protein